MARASCGDSYFRCRPGVQEGKHVQLTDTPTSVSKTRGELIRHMGPARKIQLVGDW